MAEPDESPNLPTKVLILGGGFLGCAVAHAFLDRGHSVRLLTRSAPRDAARRQRATGAEIVVDDVSDTGALSAALTDVSHVIYALGASSPARSQSNPAADLAYTVPMLVRLLELLRSRPNVGLTYLSSGGAIYGDGHGLPAWPEDAHTTPMSAYGIAKLTCEHYIAMYRELYGIPARTLRISNAYGPGQMTGAGQGVIAYLLNSALTGTPMTLFGPDESVRDYIYIDDVADTIAWAAFAQDCPPVLNVGSGEAYSMTEVVDVVKSVTGRPIPAKIVARRAYDVRRNVLDITRLRSSRDFHPIDLAQGINRTWKSLLEAHAEVEL